jgi:hypothetical protein
MNVRFTGKNRRLAEAAIEKLTDERPMTLRQLYYRLVSDGLIRPEQREYRRLGNLMTRLREAKAVPRTWLVDHIRSTLKPSSWTGLADFGESVRASYRLNYWASLNSCVEVFVEKDAVAGTVQPVTAEYDIPLRVCRGYASLSFVGEIADLWARIQKPIFAYYLGDFDASGFDIERDLQEKLERYSGRSIADYADSDTIIWQRLGVKPDDFDRLGLIELPVKSSDRRAAGFIRKYGRRCAEVDAIPPNMLRQRVREAIECHIDFEEWERLQQVEELERQTLQRCVDLLGSTN